MTTDSSEQKIIVMPCSGIGKVHGLIAREATYAVTDKLAPASTETLCLALLVSGDEEAVVKIQQANCVTIDGCPKLCAYKNVEMAGGNIIKSLRVVDAFRNHRGAQPGTATALAEDGWTIVQEIAEDAVGGICRKCESEVDGNV